MLSQLMTSQTLRYMFDHLLNLLLTGGNREEEGNTKMWISWERKKFLDQIKSIFYISKGYHLTKKINIANTNFKNMKTWKTNMTKKN